MVTATSYLNITTAVITDDKTNLYYKYYKYHQYFDHQGWFR